MFKKYCKTVNKIPWAFTLFTGSSIKIFLSFGYSQIRLAKRLPTQLSNGCAHPWSESPWRRFIVDLTIGIVCHLSRTICSSSMRLLIGCCRSLKGLWALSPPEIRHLLTSSRYTVTSVNCRNRCLKKFVDTDGFYRAIRGRWQSSLLVFFFSRTWPWTTFRLPVWLFLQKPTDNATLRR